MATPMSLESPEDQIEAGVNPSVPSELLAAAPSCSSRGMVVGRFDRIREAIEIIESAQNLIESGTVTVNKQQCKRIADRYSVLAERLKSLDWDGDNSVDVGDGGSSGSEGFDDLIRVLQKGKNLISGYDASHRMPKLICRTDNREEFAERNDEFDAVVSKLGLQGREDAASELSCAMEKTLTSDAEADKTEIRLQMSELKQTRAGPGVEKSAQVVLEKLEHVKNLVEDNPEKLPSYLTINLSEIELGDVVREYERLSPQDLEEKIGWAVVRSGRWINFDFAMKVFDCRADGDGKAKWNQKQLLKEVGSLVELQHPHVVRLVGFGKDADRSVLVTELMDSDLRNFMIKKLKSSPGLAKPFTDSEEFDVIFQIAKGMHFIHSKGYAHGDPKCSNIMVKSNGKCLEVKIGDLRGSQKRGEWNPEAFKEASEAKRPRWTAPEALDHYNDLVPGPSWEMLRDSDIYSFGMICYEVVTGKLPFQGIIGKETLKKLILKDKARPELPENLDENLKGLIKSCWDEDRKKRPGFEAICHLLDMKSAQSKSAVEKYPSCTGAVMQQISLSVRCLLSPSEKPSQINRDFYAPEKLRIPDYLKIEPEQLKRGEVIGSGSFATVYETKWLRCKFAQKVLKKRNSVTEALQHEINSLIKVSRHPCIVQIVGLSINPSDGECSIILEYMKGTLRKLIDSRIDSRSLRKERGAEETTKKRPFDFDEEVLIISRIALGMAYLHSQGFVHRDLNSCNVLAQEYPGRSIDVKIVDFGISDHKESLNIETHDHDGGDDPKATPTDQQVPNQESKVPLNGYYSGQGTGFYRPPEMLPIRGEGPEEDLSKLGLPDKSLKPDLEALKATDVYSFAMTCHEVLTGNSPSELQNCNSLKMQLKEAFAKIRSEGYRPKWPEFNLDITELDQSDQLEAQTLLSELKSFVEFKLHDKTNYSFKEKLLELKELNMEMLKRKRPVLKLLGQKCLEQELKWLVERCWLTSPKDRPTFDDICQVLLKIQNTSCQLNQIIM